MEHSTRCTVSGFVRWAKGDDGVVRTARVTLQKHEEGNWQDVAHATARSDSAGRYEIEFVSEKVTKYRVRSTAFGVAGHSEEFEGVAGKTYTRDVMLKLELKLVFKGYREDGTVIDAPTRVGRRFLARLETEPKIAEHVKTHEWGVSHNAGLAKLKVWGEADVVAKQAGEHKVWLTIVDQNDASIRIETVESIAEADVQMVGGKMDVRLDPSTPFNLRLERTATPPTRDQAFWGAIRSHAQAISFQAYREFIDRVMCAGYDFHTPMGNDVLDPEIRKVHNARHGVQAYELLKVATQVFLLLNCGVRAERGRNAEYAPFESVDDRLSEYLGCPAQLPYIKRVIRDAFPWLEREGWRRDCVLMEVHEPCLIELIKDYFLEEGMLMQTMNAITLRFQNVHALADRDPLANFEIDPLRPLGNILWGRSQDLHLLSVRRRAYEYMHQYGLTLYGKATTSMRPADSRSKFLEAFHNLLYLCSVFFKEDNDTTVIADGYPLLNALKEVHLVLAQGASNQFGDLPWTARAETLVTQWILAQTETRDFLQSRAMVPYTEPWMPQVDTMKSLQGWTDVTISNFRDLAEYGERIVLSIRFGDWIGDLGEDHAKNWARFFRAEIQAYLHAYRAVTGVDLTNPDTVDATLPAVHLQRRLALQHVAR